MAYPDENVTARVVSVGELFKNTIEPLLRIPSYQRDYEWTETQIVALCRDILAAAMTGRREYPTGTLILHENAKFRDIVDGQQRLSTICMLANNDGVLAVESAPAEYKGFGKLSKEKADKLLHEVTKKIGPIELERVRTYLPHCTFVYIVVKDEAEAFQLFDTQNGRGKPLTAANLLKAYHFHEFAHAGIGGRPEAGRDRQYELEGLWEGIDKDGALLDDLIETHLFRLRRWCRGAEFYKVFQKRKHIGEFKGVTLGQGGGVAPCHSNAFLKRFFRKQYGESGLSLAGMPSRMGGEGKDPANLDPFASIVQPIVNGEDFFLYVVTFATAYKMLFENMVPESLMVFHEFYRANCRNYEKAWQGTGSASRTVFESLCLLLFDRFGREGLLAHYRLMYRCAYLECSRQAWTWAQTPGETFAKRAAQVMIANETSAELAEAFAELGADIDQYCRDNPCSEAGRYHLPPKQRAIVNGEPSIDAHKEAAT